MILVRFGLVYIRMVNVISTQGLVYFVIFAFARK